MSLTRVSCDDGPNKQAASELLCSIHHCRCVVGLASDATEDLSRTGTRFVALRSIRQPITTVDDRRLDRIWRTNRGCSETIYSMMIRRQGSTRV